MNPRQEKCADEAEEMQGIYLGYATPDERLVSNYMLSQALLIAVAENKSAQDEKETHTAVAAEITNADMTKKNHEDKNSA